MEGHAPRATSVTDCLGAFTNSPRVAQELFDAGLLLYLYQPHLQYSASGHVTVKVVDPSGSSDIVVMESDPPFPVVFEGSATDRQKIVSIHKYSQTWMVYGDPFVDEHNTSNPHTTGKPSMWYTSKTIPMSDLL